MLKGWLICIGLTVTALAAASCTPHTLAQDLLTGVALPAATQTAEATTQAVANAGKSMAQNNNVKGRPLVIVVPNSNNNPKWAVFHMPNGQEVVIIRQDLITPDRRD